MNYLEAIGFAWIFATATLAHVYVVVAVYKFTRALIDNAREHVIQEAQYAKRGYTEAMCDIRAAAQVRYEVERSR